MFTVHVTKALRFGVQGYQVICISLLSLTRPLGSIAIGNLYSSGCIEKNHDDDASAEDDRKTKEVSGQKTMRISDIELPSFSVDLACLMAKK